MTFAVAAMTASLVELVKAAGKAVQSAAVTCDATKHGKGLDGIAYVKTWPGAWKKEKHAANVFAAMKAGHFGPWRWVPVQPDPRLVVLVSHDAVAIGDSPPCRIPINQSNCQRICDRLSAQLGYRVMMPTPKIVDATQLAAIASGRAIEAVTIWNDPAEPKYEGRARNEGQDVSQWLRQQERIKAKVAASGGYPTSGGALSTVGKDLVLVPNTAKVATATHVGGAGAESKVPGPKDTIYGWHQKAKPEPGGPFPPTMAELTAKGWPSVIQQESSVHLDQDVGGEEGFGGFWDYSSSLRLVRDDCLLDGKAAKLSAIYKTLPGLVYVFPGLSGSVTPIPIASRYPMVPAP